MITIEDIVASLFNLNIWSVIKIFILAALILYLIFSIIIIREVKLMNRTLKGVFNLPITIIAWLHFGLACLIFILALVIL